MRPLIVCTMHPSLSEQVQELIDVSDSDHNGHIDFNEFCHLMYDHVSICTRTVCTRNRHIDFNELCHAPVPSSRRHRYVIRG